MRNLQSLMKIVMLSVAIVNSIQDGEDQEDPPTNFSPLTSTNVRINPEKLFDFSFIPFDRLV